MIYACCDELRRAAVAAHPLLNGIDYLEVLDQDAPAGSPRQRTLLLRLLKPVPVGMTEDNVRIDGGERVRRVRVEWAAPAAPPPPLATPAEQSYFAALTAPDHVLAIRTDVYGDFSAYRLRLARAAAAESPPKGFDPRLTEVEFSFKVECASDFDCGAVAPCPDLPRPPTDIDYLAKDYASFRRLLLDRLSRQVPGWRERSPADLGVTLAELLAYVGDHLSYWQDAVATEAYLETARRRTSLRRHALLVDYPMHDGCNEDMERLTNDKDGQGVLRSALWATQGRARVVTWTTGDKTDEFTFTGGVILLANRPLAALPELKALATRIAVYHLEVTDLELSSMLCELTAAGYRRGDKLVLQPETCAEVGGYLLNECRTAACPLDLRMLFNAYHDYLLWEADQTRCHWHDLVSTRVRETASTFKHDAEESSVEEKKAQCRKAVREIMKITSVAGEQIKLYYERTGKSRADFYRHKNEVLSGEFDSEAPPEENPA